MLWYLLFDFFIIPLILSTPSDAICLHNPFLKGLSIFPTFTSFLPISLRPFQQDFFLHSMDTLLGKKMSRLMLPNPVSVSQSLLS